MGACAGKRSSHSSQLQQYCKQPKDTQQYKNINLPKLSFHSILANVKIKNCCHSAVSIKFTIEGVQTFGLAKKDLKQDGTAKWRIQHKLGFQKTQYQLRKTFVVLQFQDQIGSVFGCIKINLFLLCTGPYHQDFAINTKNNQFGRVSFDFRVSQVIQLQLESTRCQIQLTTKHPGQKFNYSIRTIVDHNSLISFPSYTIVVMVDNKQKNVVQNQVSSSKRKNTIKVKKRIQEGKNLVWIKQQQKQLPTLTLNMQAFDLHHACFQIMIWKINDKNSTSDQQQKSQLYAQCYISFQKLFLQQSNDIKFNGDDYQQRYIDVQEKLWNHGKQLGKGRFKFYIRNQRYIKQMQVCVSTQHGILKSSPVFDPTKKKSSKQAICQQLKELINISQEIQANVITLDKFQSHQESSCQRPISNAAHIKASNEIRNLQIGIEKSLKKIVPILEKSVKQSVIFYNYSSTDQLQKAQKTFISIGMKIFDYIQQQDPVISQLCWSILIALLRRGQFMLCYIGFDENQNNKISEGNINQAIRKKIDIALQYQQWMHKLLQLALNSLNVKGHQCQRTFAEVFCAYAYFRIPQFRKKILQAICKDDDPQILQWRGIQFSLNEDIDYQQIKQDVNTFTILFDWGNSFHKALQKQEKYQNNSSQLNDILLKDQWNQRMSRRGTAFFFFLRFWVLYVQQITVKSKYIQWKYFPGYNRLIRSFLVELKKRSILQYPDAIKITLTALLSNQKLLNAFVVILLGKGNLNQPLTVLKSIQLINLLFQTITQKKRKIPHTFNYLLFFQGIKIILQSEFSYAISQILNLIYSHFNLFHNQFKRNLSMYLLGKAFFKLFLHWSHNVRVVFYYLITMRIYHQTNVLHSLDHQQGVISCKFKHKYNQDVKSRYQELLNSLIKAEKYKSQQGKFEIRNRYEKQYYKKMKKKLQKNRKGSQSVNKTKASQGRNLINQLNLQNSRVLSDKHQNSTSQKFKYSFQSVQKSKIQRTHSQVFVPKVLTNNGNRISKNQQVVKIKKSSSFRYKHQVVDNTAGTSHQQKMMMNYLFQDDDFEVQPFTAQQLSYISISMKQFNDINEQFLVYQKNGGRNPPKVKVGMIPIDEKQIRPDQIDDW